MDKEKTQKYTYATNCQTYAPDSKSKFLIIHADDFGLCHSQNMAIIQAIEHGFVNSVSIMPPCPWFFEAIIYAQNNPSVDIGVHITLICEWPLYKWGPVSPLDKVSSLVDENGFLHSSIEGAKLDEVEIEICAQIEKVLSFGIKPSHIDSHGFVLSSNHELIELYYKIGQKYNLPILTSANLNNIKHYDSSEKYPLFVDNILIANPESRSDIDYEKMLRSMVHGITVLLVHPAFDNIEMQGVAAFKGWKFGPKWRQQDFDFLTSPLCEKIIKEENIILITWESINNRIKANKNESINLQLTTSCE